MILFYLVVISLILGMLCTLQAQPESKIITVNFDNVTGKLKNLNSVNRGPYESHIGDKTLGYTDARIQSIRTHDYHDAFDYEHYSDFWHYNATTDTYTNINTDFDPADASHYHWEATDENLRRIIDNGMEPYFRLGVSYPDNPKYTTPPLTPPYDADMTSFSNFASLCKHTVMHCNGDWANGLNANIKYWEVWNEPGGAFWKGSNDAFFRMYEAVYHAIKSYDATLKVGALGAVPTTTLGYQEEYRSNFMNWLKINDVGLDFYSWHLYGLKNPYGLKAVADEIRGLLDEHGLTDAESHISEINDELGEGLAEKNKSPEGAAYYLSCMITAQQSPVDLLLWYTGMGFFDNDNNGAQPYYSGYALKIFGLMYENTPNQLAVTGDEIVEDEWQTEGLTNFMTLAGKSDDGNAVYCAISNLNSSNTGFTVTINNLPWQQMERVKVRVNYLTETKKFAEEQYVMNASPDLEIPVSNVASPSVVFVRIEKSDCSESTVHNLELGEDITFCEGEQYSIDAGGGYSEYLWNDNSTMQILEVNSSGVYSVQVTDENGCTSSDAVSVQVHPKPEKPVITQNNNKLVSSADAGNQWYAEGKKLPGKTGKTLELRKTGIYFVEVTNPHGCTNRSDDFTVETTQIKDVLNNCMVDIYPNPAQSFFTVSARAEKRYNWEITVLTAAGRVIISESVKNKEQFQKTISTGNLSKGMYYIEVRNKKGLKRKNIIVN